MAADKRNSNAMEEAPAARRPVRAGAIEKIALCIAFYAIITPYGWLRRLFIRHDPLRRDFTDETSYRVISRKLPRDSLKHP